jgi:hypothetical protein
VSAQLGHTSVNGIDLIARDPTRERLVVVETKWTGDDEPVTAAKLGGAPEDNLEDAVNALIEAESFESRFFYVSSSVGDGTVSTRPVTRDGSENNPPTDLYVNGEFDAPNTEEIFNSDRTYHFKAGGISEDDWVNRRTPGTTRPSAGL